MPVPLDEYPVHQVPMSMQHMATSDRNAYDRCYLNAHDRTGQVFLVTGIGVYPNLGVIDAYATVRHGERQQTLRMSDALGDDRMNQSVGPYRIEVLEPLHKHPGRLRRRRTRVGFRPGLDRIVPRRRRAPPRHAPRRKGHPRRPALRPGGDVVRAVARRRRGDRRHPRHVARDPGPLLGHPPRGRSEPPGRGAPEPDDDFGFWWIYAPLRFEDFALIVIIQENGDGTRILNEAVRVWPALVGTSPRATGLARARHPLPQRDTPPRGAVMHLAQRGGRPLDVEIDTLGFVALNCGPGYGGDPDWGHGQWRGRGLVERVSVDLDDPAIAGRVRFGVVDHVARAVCDGAEGWGMFEHGTFGRHAPSGFDRLGLGGSVTSDPPAGVESDPQDAPRPRTSTRDRADLRRSTGCHGWATR